MLKNALKNIKTAGPVDIVIFIGAAVNIVVITAIVVYWLIKL